MYLIPADRLHGSPREPAVSIPKQKQTVKKRKHHNPNAEADRIRKHHPYGELLKMRKKMDDADLKKRLRRMCLRNF